MIFGVLVLPPAPADQQSVPYSDDDGTNDGDEVAQGSHPADGSDNGQPQEDKYLDVKLTVGDHSGSHSERYNLKVGSITHQAPEFGVVEEPTGLSGRALILVSPGSRTFHQYRFLLR